MTLSDLERLAREVVAYDEWSDAVAEHYRAGKPPDETPPAPPQPMMDERGDIFLTALGLAHGSLALLRVVRAAVACQESVDAEDVRCFHVPGCPIDAALCGLLDALAALNLKDET